VIVLVTHDPAVAAWAQRIIRLDAGSVVADRRTTPQPAGAELQAGGAR
jgi:ABC-type lipoprotein export system ATPase subunit